MHARILTLIFLMALSLSASGKPKIVVGSKNFTESFILAEIISQIIESSGEASVERKFGLGGTGIVFTSLEEEEIDLYPEYTGTLVQAILKDKGSFSIDEINKKLRPRNLLISSSLGFNNTYALGIRQKYMDQGITKISDLKKVPGIPAAFSYEFMKREDGLIPLKETYEIELPNIKAMEHSLIYSAFSNERVDLVEVFSTDAKIAKNNIVLLKDDKNFFPVYEGVLATRKSFPKRFPKVWNKLLEKLHGKIDNQTMQSLNAKVDIEKWSFSKTAHFFLEGEEITSRPIGEVNYKKLWFYTQEHLFLVFISLSLSILVGVPFGIISSRSKWAGQILLSLSGLIQTIPSLALLCFFIPLFGIGKLPALMALFLYGLLPIARGTYTGVIGISPRFIDVSTVLGLSAWQRLLKVELPLASRSLLSGIRTSAVINVGTATLAAFVGGGGLGTFIVSGLSLNDNGIILQGAIPSAVLALLVHFCFEVLEKLLIPRGIR